MPFVVLPFPFVLLSGEVFTNSESISFRCLEGSFESFTVVVSYQPLTFDIPIAKVSFVCKLGSFVLSEPMINAVREESFELASIAEYQ